jgi:hypothetical protein
MVLVSLRRWRSSVVAAINGTNAWSTFRTFVKLKARGSSPDFRAVRYITERTKL